MNTYCISESCIIVRDYMVNANSEEEAKKKFNSGEWVMVTYQDFTLNK